MDPPTDDDEPPTLVELDEPDPEWEKPGDIQDQGAPPVMGKQFERQVPVTLITGYLGALLQHSSSYSLYKAYAEYLIRNICPVVF